MKNFSIDSLINPMFIDSSLKNFFDKKCNSRSCKRKETNLYICTWGRDVCLLNLCAFHIRKIDKNCVLVKELDTKDIFTLQILNEKL